MQLCQTTCKSGKAKARKLFYRVEGEIGRGCYWKKSSLDETGSLKYGGFSLAQFWQLWQSLIGWGVARLGEKLPLPASGSKVATLPARVARSLFWCDLYLPFWPPNSTSVRFLFINFHRTIACLGSGQWSLKSQVQFSSVAQSCPTLCDPMNLSTPSLPVHHQLRSSLKLTSIESVTPSSHLILCRPLLLLPPIPPSIRVFSKESTLHMRWPKYWSFSFSIKVVLYIINTCFKWYYII